MATPQVSNGNTDGSTRNGHDARNGQQSTQARAPMPWTERLANRNGRESIALRVPTRELKFNIAVLAAWLNNPVEVAKMNKDSRIGMELRLGALRDELAARLARFAIRDAMLLQGTEPTLTAESPAQQGKRHLCLVTPQVAH